MSAGSASLRLCMGGGLDYEMFQVSRDVFYAPGLDYWLAFTGTPSPAAMHVRSVFVDAVARRVT